jgi:transposase
LRIYFFGVPGLFSFPTELWTLPRVAKIIEIHHPGHVWYILRDMGWSSQKPERRDEEALA